MEKSKLKTFLCIVGICILVLIVGISIYLSNQPRATETQISEVEEITEKDTQPEQETTITEERTTVDESTTNSTNQSKNNTDITDASVEESPPGTNEPSDPVPEPEPDPIVLSAISIKTLPTKQTYLESKDTLDLAGGEILVSYSDNSTETIPMLTNSSLTTGLAVSGFSNSTPTQSQPITISYTKGDTTKTTTFNISIIAKSIEEISWATQPTYTSFREGEDFAVNGSIEIDYNNDTTKTVTPLGNLTIRSDDTRYLEVDTTLQPSSATLSGW